MNDLRMKMIFFVFLISVWLCACARPSRHVEYFPDGKVEFEIPVKDGKWNGQGVGYFSSGKKRGVVTYVDGKMEGESFEYYESGNVLEERYYAGGIRVGKWNMYDSNHNLVEEVFYSDLGRVLDFHRYRSGSRDSSYLFPIAYVLDSARTGVVDTFFVKIGNTDSLRYQKGVMLITSGFRDSKPVDTVRLIYGDNRDGFLYEFTPASKGENRINGELVIAVEGRQIPFIFEYVYKAK